MNTEHTRDLDRDYYVNANGDLVRVPSGAEEFYNQCHDEDGKFCRDAIGGDLKVGGDGAQGKTRSHKNKSAEDTLDEVKRFAELFIGLPGQSSLKAHKFAKRSLSRYTSGELCHFHSQFQADAKNLKTARKTAYVGIATIPLNTNRLFIAASSVTRSSIVIGFTVWRGRRIKQQMDRIDATVNKRKAKPGSPGRIKRAVDKRRTAKGAKLELEGLQEFAGATELDPSLIVEIRKAQKQIDEGRFETVETPTKQELLDAQQYVKALRIDPEEGISQIIIDAMRTTVDEALKNTK